MAKPFSDLEKRAIALVAVMPDYNQWPDEELRNYWKWKIRADKSSHNLPPASERPNGRKLDKVAIEPFAGMPVDNLFAKVSISKRSNTAAGAPLKTALGFKTLTDGSANTPVQKSITLGKFKPARVYWRTGAAESSITRPPSRITGRVYKSYYSATDEGYTAPFGKVGTDTLVARQKAIITALENINLITFSPEIYRD